MYNDLRAIAAFQDDYRAEHGSYALSLAELTNVTTHFTLQLSGDGKHWAITVPSQNVFPGSYFFGDDRKVHFSTTGPATTNDMVLCAL
jgi:hypothetical protein